MHSAKLFPRPQPGSAIITEKNLQKEDEYGKQFEFIK